MEFMPPYYFAFFRPRRIHNSFSFGITQRLELPCHPRVCAKNSSHFISPLSFKAVTEIQKRAAFAIYGHLVLGCFFYLMACTLSLIHISEPTRLGMISYA